MRPAQLLPIVLLATALLGCGSITSRAPTSANGARPLVAPSALNSERTANQVVHGAFGDREMTINCVLSVRDGVATVVGLTALGVRAFTLKFDGAKVQVENDLPVPPQLTPERLLADIQLVYWPASALKSVLSKQGWELTEPYERTRRLKRGEKLVAEVHYDAAEPWTGRSWLVNLEYGYTLGIDSSLLPAR